MVKTHIKDRNELIKRLFVTGMVVILYLIGLLIPLFGVELDLDETIEINAQTMVMTMLSGVNSTKTLMALGIMPYINASILVQLFSLFRNPEKRARISRKRTAFVTGILTLFISLFYAHYMTDDFTYIEGMSFYFARSIVMIQMMGGILLLAVMIEINKKYGIGESSPIIFVNVVKNLIFIFGRENVWHYKLLCILLFFEVLFLIVMESYIVKMPLQKAMINNVHADQNYLGFKLNPVGIMPVMIGTALFSIPQIILGMLHNNNPNNERIAYWANHLSLDQDWGIAFYVIFVFLQTFAFSFLILNPREITKNLRENGDSIVGVRSGIKTYNYITIRLLGLCLLSGLMESACMAISLSFAYYHLQPLTISMLPMNFMLIASLLLSLNREILFYFRYDRYRLFI